jgi:hypothetical protein
MSNKGDARPVLFEDIGDSSKGVRRRRSAIRPYCFVTVSPSIMTSRT